MDELTYESTTKRIETDAPAKESVWRQLACSGSVFLWLVITIILLFQPDLLAAFTLVPPWCWIIAGVVMGLVGFQRAAWRWSLLALALWIVFAFVFVDETQGLWRGIARHLDPQTASEFSSDTVRVISFNCAGDPRSADELTQLEPDIVLLQESPGTKKLSELAKAWFGSSGNYVSHGDTAILAAGTFDDLTPDGETCFSHARVQLAEGAELDLISLRLAPPIFRTDFWSARFWTDHRDRRDDHRSELGQVLGQLRRESAQHSFVLGGDFNTTPIDLVLNGLRTRAFDTFRAAGQGLGNTGTNQYPLFRVDQIWASRDIDAVSSIARPSKHSDHRMVISDLRLPARQSEP